MEQLTEILVHPATWAIIGILAKAFAPAAIPFLGAGRKLVKELTELHDKNNHDNSDIKKHAADLGLKVAEKWIQTKLLGSDSKD